MYSVVYLYQLPTCSNNVYHSHILLDNTIQSLGIDKKYCNLALDNREDILWNKLS